MLFVGLYYSAKFYVYRTIITRTHYQVRFQNIQLSVFPLGLKAHDIKNFPIKADNLLSFDRVHATIPFTALFARKKEINLEIEHPVFYLNENLFRVRRDQPDSPFVLNRVDVRNGEVIYNSPQLFLNLKQFELQSNLKPTGNTYRLSSPHLKVIATIANEPVSVEGNFEAEFKDTRDFIRLSLFSWKTRDFTFTANGRWTKKEKSFVASAYFQGNPEKLVQPVMSDFTMRGMIYSNLSIQKTASNKITVAADFNAPEFFIADIHHDSLNGNLEWDSVTRRLRLESHFNAYNLASSVTVHTGDGTTINVRDLPAYTAARLVKEEDVVPVGGIVSNGTVKITKKSISGELEIKPGTVTYVPAEEGDKAIFQAAGKIRFEKDKASKTWEIQASRLQHEVGNFSLNCRLRPGEVDLQVGADLHNLAHADLFSKFYIDLRLNSWYLEGGSGRFELNLQKRNGVKRITTRVNAKDFFSNRQHIAQLSGRSETVNGRTTGTYAVNSPDLQGSAVMQAGGGRTRFDLHLERGEAAKIMKILDFDVDLRGPSSGDFVYEKATRRDPLVTGSFRAARLGVEAFDLEEVSGFLTAGPRMLDIREGRFLYKGGRGWMQANIHFGDRRFLVKGGVEQIDMARFSGDLTGRLDLTVDSSGAFQQDPIVVDYHLRQAFLHKDRTFQADGTANIYTDFNDFTIKTTGNLFNPSSTSPYLLEIAKARSVYTGRYTANLTDLNLVIPWKHNVGELQVQGEIFTDSQGSMHTRGTAVAKGTTLSLPNFPHSLNNFLGFINFADTQFTLQSLSGEMGGGSLSAQGNVQLEEGKLKNLFINVFGKEMMLYPMDRVSSKVDGDLSVRLVKEKLLLSGNLNFRSASWEREVQDGIAFYSNSAGLSMAESKIIDMLEFDLTLNGEENVWLNNSFGKMKGRFNLHLTGNPDFPVLTGTIESQRGELYLSGRPFNILKTKLNFSSKYLRDPILSVEAEAFIRDYRIRFTMSGTLFHPRLEFTSSPPLPPAEILTLISLGEIFKRYSSAEISSQIGSTAFLTSKLNEQISERARKLLGIDVLRIDPMYTGKTSQNSSRLTIGKAIFKDLMVVYSTNLSSSEDYAILYLQYQIAPGISLIGMRNEDGKFSIDIYFRKRN